MNAFILTWNPNAYEWDELEKDIKKIETDGFIECAWTCMSSQPKRDDEFYIFLLGTKLRGIVGYGTVDGLELDQESPYNHSGKTNIINGKLLAMINPYKDRILEYELLKRTFPDQLWNPRQSGIRIRPELCDKVRELWNDFANQSNILSSINDDLEITEGSISQVLSTKYERNKNAREACLNHYGYTCFVCKMDFYQIYGEVGKKFIHVHHKYFISQYASIHKIDPINDLVPLCPNCHAMLHRKMGDKYLTVEQLINIYKDRNTNA